MSLTRKDWILVAVGAAVLAGGGWWYWQAQQAGREPAGFAAGNGRVEATEIAIAAKMPGRVQDILVDEGDDVQAGQVVAHLDASAMRAQLAQAQAQVADMKSRKASAQALVAKAQADVATAQAQLRLREGEQAMARTTLARTQALLADRAISQQQVDEDRTRVNSAEAAVSVAQAQIRAAQEGLRVAQAQVDQTDAGIEAAEAGVTRLSSELGDTTLKAPRAGRIQYRVVQPGEVVGAGGRVLSMLDTNDVYMTFFLPEAQAGRLALGSEVRLVLDAAPERAIPATVSYVSSVAQFTPKSVETQNEREKLMFRIKARIDPQLLARYRDQIKSGVPGVAHVRLDAQRQWPGNLQLRQP